MGMDSLFSLCRYSGNKSKLLADYRDHRHMNVSRIVEPYLGSGAFSLNQTLPAVGYEINTALVAMWNWLKECSADDLMELNAFVEDAKSREEKPNVKDMGLDLGPQTYVRVNVCSVVVGQLSSWRIYPQHSLPIQSTLACIPRLRNIEVRNESANAYEHSAGDLLFIDPPYVGTVGNYKGETNHEKEYRPEDTVRLISSTTNPIMLTYGTNAPEVFPDYKWHVVKKKKVPNMRKGGTVDRIEYVSYINWIDAEPNTLF